MCKKTGTTKPKTWRSRRNGVSEVQGHDHVKVRVPKYTDREN